MATPNIAGTLRRSLLIKIISKAAPSREDLDSVIELTASKVVEALQAQSMTFYIVEGNEITFKHVFYSPSLWARQTELVLRCSTENRWRTAKSQRSLQPL